MPAGSVAIGGEHTGIYSIASPGGWWLLGRTDAEIFSAEKARDDGSAEAFLLRQGDSVKFLPVEEFESLKRVFAMESETPVLEVLAVWCRDHAFRILEEAVGSDSGFRQAARWTSSRRGRANLLVGNECGSACSRAALHRGKIPGPELFRVGHCWGGGRVRMAYLEKFSR